MHYEDDGSSMEYRKSVYCKREMVFDPSVKKIIIPPQEGNYPTHFTFLHIIFHGFNEELKDVKTSNGIIKPETDQGVMFDAHAELEGYL